MLKFAIYLTESTALAWKANTMNQKETRSATIEKVAVHTATETHKPYHLLTILPCPLPRWKEKQPAPGLWHRHGKPRDREGCRGHPVAVQEIPEKEAWCQVLERAMSATSSLDVVLHVNQTAPSWTEKDCGVLKVEVGVGWSGVNYALWMCVCNYYVIMTII